MRIQCSMFSDCHSLVFYANKWYFAHVLTFHVDREKVRGFETPFIDCSKVTELLPNELVVYLPTLH